MARGWGEESQVWSLTASGSHRSPQFVVRCHTKYTLLGDWGCYSPPTGSKSSLPSARCQNLRRLQPEKEIMKRRAFRSIHDGLLLLARGLNIHSVEGVWTRVVRLLPARRVSNKAHAVRCGAGSLGMLRMPQGSPARGYALAEHRNLNRKLLSLGTQRCGSRRLSCASG